MLLGRPFRCTLRVSRLHQPQFCMLEWYRPGVRIQDLVEDVRALGCIAAAALDLPAPPAAHDWVAGTLFQDQ